MNKTDKEYLRLGKMVAGMVSDLGVVSGTDVGFARRLISFRRGNFFDLFVVKGSRLCEAFEAAAERGFSVQTATPKSEVN